MKSIFAALSAGLALIVMASSASAVPFSYRFDSQVAFIPFGTFGAIGDPVSITMTLDNGGASDLSQVWTVAHLQSVTFDINNGAAVVSFFSPFDGGLRDEAGNFETDAAGNLISAPSSWIDTGITEDFAANFSFGTDGGWLVNGGNVVLGGDISLFLADVEGNTDPANWSRVTALPLPPTLLLLLVGLGGVALLRRAGPGTASGFALARGA